MFKEGKTEVRKKVWVSKLTLEQGKWFKAYKRRDIFYKCLYYEMPRYGQVFWNMNRLVLAIGKKYLIL